MADVPRPPRQPPPLPALPLKRIEPAASDEPAPDTQRSSPRARNEIPPPPLDPLSETTAGLLREELALIREVVRDRLPTLPSIPLVTTASVPPVSIRTRSRKEVAALVAGKYGVLVLALPTILRAVVAKMWPASSPIIESILGPLGL